VYVTVIAVIISHQCLHLLQCIADDVSVYIVIYVRELCDMTSFVSEASLNPNNRKKLMAN